MKFDNELIEANIFSILGKCVTQFKKDTHKQLEFHKIGLLLN